ncbi:oxidoreductase, putative [Acanthamoeba castellanii str. Neff]|uniref:procollagen-proline 3-dioxygenase n=1 Tax=Acanthamoeba castellanii (strain ATCC 30010 / Neff) TaxID=1257118 RepID=L8GXU4_ACACF|nr:oxidoreductase, putative [Acanthamoeba castellanii str. Neff]ELR17383.1 oxidoreductase, putative [Acanthamoeba castellanii str. Neff]
MSGRRWVVEEFISRAECRELIRVHRASGVVGYRDRFSVTTLREPLARTSDWPLLLPFVRLRDRLRDAVEERTGEHLALFVEWTGLSCWHPHSSIPPHYDSNRPYLEQRHYSVVLYLNDAGTDFDGGTFQFFGDKVIAGRLLIFASGPENIHGVTPITRGERFTFTVWLTRDEACWEDPKILSHLPSTLPPSLALTPDPPAFFFSRPSTAADADADAAKRSCTDPYSTPALSQGDHEAKFDLEAEVLKQLEMEVWTRRVGHVRQPRKRPRTTDHPAAHIDPNRAGDDYAATPNAQHAEDADDGGGGDDGGEEEEEEEGEVVVVRWRGRVVPLRFESVRRAVELVAFAAATPNDARDGHEEGWWRQRAVEWLDHRRQLAAQLRVALPKWKDAGCLYDYQPF